MRSMVGLYSLYLLEKYTKGVSAVESILTLDRLRQNVAVKELETAHGQPLSMRKTVSVPNFSQVMYKRVSLIFCNRASKECSYTKNCSSFRKKKSSSLSLSQCFSRPYSHQIFLLLSVSSLLSHPYLLLYFLTKKKNQKFVVSVFCCPHI